jgi:hypothetical protein
MLASLQNVLRSARLRATILPCTALLAVLVLAPACLQNDGDRCQLNSDCSSGNCVLRQTGGLPEGTCEPPGTGVTIDQGTSKVDVGTTQHDASLPDKSAPDHTPADTVPHE